MGLGCTWCVCGADAPRRVHRVHRVIVTHYYYWGNATCGRCRRVPIQHLVRKLTICVEHYGISNQWAWRLAAELVRRHAVITARWNNASIQRQSRVLISMNIKLIKCVMMANHVIMVLPITVDWLLVPTYLIMQSAEEASLIRGHMLQNHENESSCPNATSFFLSQYELEEWEQHYILMQNCLIC